MIAVFATTHATPTAVVTVMTLLSQEVSALQSWRRTLEASLAAQHINDNNSSQRQHPSSRQWR
jgi:hypothetical protein